MKLDIWALEDAARTGDTARIVEIFSRAFPDACLDSIKDWQVRRIASAPWPRVSCRVGIDNYVSVDCRTFWHLVMAHNRVPNIIIEGFPDPDAAI